MSNLIRAGYIYSLIISILFILNSCSQEGEVGPRGLQGTQILSGNAVPDSNIGGDGDFYFNSQTGDLYGPKINNNWGVPFNIKGSKGDNGSNGLPGANGEAGKTILSGNGSPSTTQGTNGDFYINLQNSDFYGPKTSSGWGSPINLKGISGTIIHNGNAAPSGTIGNIGDYYLDKNAGLLYGPKTSTGWGIGLNLVGSKGAAGEAGNTILSGTNIPTSSDGKIGDFFYRTTSNDFYGPKTSSGWGNPVNLRGIPASTILSGANDPSSTIGNVGDFYIKTSTWQIYGPKSVSGWGNAVSLIGAKGDQGAAGSAGSKILVGSTNPGNIGNNGDYYINTSTGDLFGPKANNAWSASIFNMRSGQITDVIYSDWITPNSMQFVQEGDPNLVSYKIVIPEMNLDQNLINTASIVVYVQESGLSLQQTGTFQLNYQSNFWSLYVYYSLQNDGIKIFYKGIMPRIGYGAAYKIRYVIIPGNKKSNLVTAIPRNYTDFTTLYNIPK